MLEWDASPAVRAAIIGTATEVSYDTLPHGRQARAGLVERPSAKTADAQFAH